MSIYKSAVKRPITTLMIFAGVVVLGLYALVQLPIDLYPNMEFPAISVMTTYPGANAADIETNVTRKLEDAFNSIDRLKEVTSTSYDNLSVIFLELEWGTNLDFAAADDGQPQHTRLLVPSRTDNRDVAADGPLHGHFHSGSRVQISVEDDLVPKRPQG